MMLSREKNVLTLIYPRRPAEKLVLLGLKKRGFGAGKLNGFGGKLEKGETLEESAVRELAEECGLRTTPSALRWCGCLTYIYDTKPKGMEVNIFDLDHWEGEESETEEMKPSWFAHNEVPLASMWADDAWWLIQYLNEELSTPFVGRFRFKGHEGADSWVVLEHQVATLSAASVPRISSSDSDSMPGAAMVASTVSFRNAPSGRALPLESFIRFHLLKGFARVMLFVDSASDEAVLDVVRRFPDGRVVHRIRGPELLAEQKARCPSYSELEPFLESEVSARQMLDAELAMELAPSLGCHWLVCLDSDELFFTSKPSVTGHFEELAQAKIAQMTYLNHEGVPETVETEDYFATTTLFKQHHFAVSLSSEARSCLRFWMDRSKRGQYLLFYDNGKSACRTGCGARPRSQHLWQLPDGLRSYTALADPRKMDVEGYRECCDPCILHFPVCGLAWLQAKYELLGDFPDKWLGKVPLFESFHKDAREACASGGDKALADIFEKEVMLSNVEEISRQLASGTCLRITEHSQLLEAVPAPAHKSEASSTCERVPAATGYGEATQPPSVPLDEGPIGIEKGWILSKAMGFL
eukprot:TRINITY_DN76064_c0_g1_i1.p1 TRINITY_DN76064_c0_g1~~TRINITY_DN76064_c0_g1_i1.p1  ORF type:complete len:583 (+),score=99.53 TRINITY_DN76064_c0_g1_i1:55-1803(+)